MRKEGLEPSWSYPYASETYASANFATSARKNIRNVLIIPKNQLSRKPLLYHYPML